MVQLMRQVLAHADEVMLKLLLQHLNENARIAAETDYSTLNLLCRYCKEVITEKFLDDALLSEQIEEWWHTVNQFFWEKCV